ESDGKTAPTPAGGRRRTAGSTRPSAALLWHPLHRGRTRRHRRRARPDRAGGKALASRRGDPFGDGSSEVAAAALQSERRATIVAVFGGVQRLRKPSAPVI